MASVHAEARYGITVLPDFGDVGGYEPPSTDGGDVESGPELAPPLDIPPIEEWIEGEIFEEALGDELPFDELALLLPPPPVRRPDGGVSRLALS